MPTHLSAGFDRQEPNELLPALRPGVPISDNLRSVHANSNTMSVLGFGPLTAITTLLTAGATGVQRSRGIHHATSITFHNSARNRTTRTMTSAVVNHPHKNEHVRSWKDVAGQTGPFLAGLIEANLTPHLLPETHERYQKLITYLRDDLRISLPITDSQAWRTINHNLPAHSLLLALSDSLYYELRRALEKETIDYKGTYWPHKKNQTMITWEDVPPAEFGFTLPQKPDPQATNPTPELVSPLARLKRLTKTGGTALLTGPTGTLKTETAKRVAVDTRSNLVVLKGAAGIEDRDFYGTITPTPSGPAWVDGPLAKALRSATTNHTVLLIDELLRFEPLYANVLVGALDLSSPEELNLMGFTTHASDEPHYAITLPTGETLTAPKNRLTIIATTNLGDDYTQFTQIDSALLGRFELHIDMPTADPTILAKLYEKYIPHQAIIQRLFEFERWTRENTGAHGGLLQRATNPRVTLNWLKEATRLTQEASCDLREALTHSLDVTLIPYCCPRDTTGAIAEDAALILRDEFHNFLNAPVWATHKNAP